MKALFSRNSLRTANFGIVCLNLWIFWIPRAQGQLVADGATATLSNVTNIINGNVTVGTNGSFTLLVLSNNCLLTNSGLAIIGFDTAARSNEVRLISPTARWSLNNVLFVGSGGSANRLVVSNGAQVENVSGVIGGGASSASNNVALVTGAGSTWNNSNTLRVGDVGPGNQLVVSNGGTVFTGTNMTVGVNTTFSLNNRVTVDGGTLRVTNAASTAVFNIRRGANVLNDGLIEVDQLLVTNTAGKLELNGGRFSSRNTIVSNGQLFRVGNGASQATFYLAGIGTHLFNDGLSVLNHSVLAGNGSVVFFGPLTVEAGGSLSPGASIGKIILNQAPSLQGTVSMEISKNGSVLTNDQVQVQVPDALTYGGVLTVTKIGPTALTGGDRFQLFSATSYGGSFTTLSLPSLNPGLSWTLKLGVDGSIEVTGLTVQTTPATAIGSTSATLNGMANPAGNDATAWFEYGFTTNYGNVTVLQALGSGFASTNFAQVLTGLLGGVTYHFRAVASNTFGVAFGTNQTFTLPAFVPIAAGLPGISGDAAWGDFDNDGRLDLLLVGTAAPQSLSQVWRNLGSGFTNINAGLTGAFPAHAAWADYDNDGRLDILLTGATNGAASGGICQLWRNTGSNFVQVNAGLPAFAYRSVAWGDYDNDGRADLLLASQDGVLADTEILQVWRNTGNGFADVGAGLPPIFRGAAQWGDYDNDGRLDVLLAGMNGTNVITQIWRNTGTNFVNINAGLTGVYFGSVAWGDYDNDGRLDVLITGDSVKESSLNPAHFVTQVWHNTGTGFTNINASLPGLLFGNAVWGDYDNDGRLDILLAGTTNYDSNSGNPLSTSEVWRNTGSGFVNINSGLSNLDNVAVGSVAWGDYDNDGRLDILLTGQRGLPNIENFSQLWRNQTKLSNSPPFAPAGLAVNLSNNVVTFAWNATTDAQTSSDGLTYNLRVGTTPAGGEIVGATSASTGQRRLPTTGNAQRTLTRSLATLPFGQPIYWSVQAVDTAFAGGPFAPEQNFTFSTVFTPTNGVPVPGDINGDGAVDAAEFAFVLTHLNGNGVVSQGNLDQVLSNYFPNSPFLQMTNVAGLSSTNVTFALTNSFAGAFSVEYTTNLTDWLFLGPATPRYLFTDTNAPAAPQRYYRLRWP